MDFKERYFNTWKDCWDFHKKWCEHDNSDDNWKQIIDESASIMNRHKGTPEYQFAEDLMLVVIGELERKSECGKD